MFVTFSDSEVKTLRLITSRHLSCAALAKELKVSRATAAKIISSLRHKRVPISVDEDLVEHLGEEASKKQTVAR